MTAALLLLAVGFVAFTSGASANFKGVASLYGTGTTTLRRAALWGTATTFAGSVGALFLTGGLQAAFSGRGIVPDSLAAAPVFLCAVALGAAGTSFLATRLGFPVSTTHALVGALLGAGLAGAADEVRFAALGTVFLYPLVVSPVVAAAAGAASFARGLNDTPKMAALMLAVPGLEVHWGFLAVAVAIPGGGLLDIDRVAETLGRRVTGMTPGQGFAARRVTAGLVTTASLHSLPVSTTHVSVGSLLGMGTATRQAHWRKAGEIVVAWVTTVPAAAVLAAVAYWVVSRA